MRPAIKITLAVSSLLVISACGSGGAPTATATRCARAKHRIRAAFSGAKYPAASLASSQEANRYQQAGYPVQDDESE